MYTLIVFCGIRPNVVDDPKITSVDHAFVVPCDYSGSSSWRLTLLTLTMARRPNCCPFSHNQPITRENGALRPAMARAITKCILIDDDNFVKNIWSAIQSNDSGFISQNPTQLFSIVGHSSPVNGKSCGSHTKRWSALSGCAGYLPRIVGQHSACRGENMRAMGRLVTVLLVWIIPGFIQGVHKLCCWKRQWYVI